MDFQDRLEQISATIQQLRVENTGPQTRQLIDSLFRSVHSLKAAASAEGLTEFSRLAHEFENLLHSLRTGKVQLDETVLQIFGETEAAFLANIQGQSSSFDLSSLSQVDTSGSLEDAELHKAQEAVREGATLYVMDADFDTGDFDRQFLQLKEQLNSVGEVISTSAKVAEDHTDKINFRIVYAAKSEKIRVHTIFEQAVHGGKAIATSLRKQIDFIVRGDEVLLDKSASEALADALLHLVRNAVGHGIESRGTVMFEATKTAQQIRIAVSDDGRGIDPANVDLLFQPGFSTAADVTEISGRGIGLDVVATVVKQIGGTVAVTSELDKGTSFEIRLPNQL